MHLPDHGPFTAVQPDDCPDGITVTLRPAQAESDKVPLGKLVAEVIGAVVEIVDQQFQASVTVEVGDRGPARAARRLLAVHPTRQVPPLDERPPPPPPPAAPGTTAPPPPHPHVAPR